MLIISIITIILIQQNIQVICSCWTSFFLMVAQNFVMENNFSIHLTFSGHSLCFLFYFYFWSQESNIATFLYIPFCFVVQSLSCVWLFVTPWTTSCQASLSFTSFWSLLRLTSTEFLISALLFFSFGVFFFPYFFFGFMVPCWKFQDWILFIWIHWALWFCCSVTQLCLTLCNPMNCSMPGFPVLHYLPEFTQTHVYWVSDAIQPSYPPSPLSPLTLNLS